ncbi:MAG: hypothetical protein K2X93_09875 [Candidatus Obscuribacterales bacterium]|nr:hypothetical protein [Candidatus Obscuribacterales bacterium]
MATRLIKTSMAHRGYALVKIAYPLWGLLFLNLWFSNRWFETDITWFGIPSIVVVLLTSHIFLLFLESDRAARMWRLLLRGKPPALYETWLTVVTAEPDPSPARQSEEVTTTTAVDGGNNAPTRSAVYLGLKQIDLECVDELHLTLWGNLVFKSRSICGSLQKGGTVVNDADDILKVPFGVIKSDQQRDFVELLKSLRPNLIVGERLTKKLSAKTVKGEDLIQSIGALFLVFVLLDLGHSMFSYIEMLKHYHLAQVEARQVLPSEEQQKTARQQAEQHLAKAESMRESNPGISLVKRTILDKGIATADIFTARAEALFYLDQKAEAIKSIETALKYLPKSQRLHTELARYLVSSGKEREARAVLSALIATRDDAFLPRLYMIALFREDGDDANVEHFYEMYSEKMDLDVFGEEPWWPPGGNRSLGDNWYREDLHFVFDRILKKK